MKRIINSIKKRWKSYRDTLPAKNTNPNDPKFGVFDTSTGEMRKGYITRGGDMAYEKTGVKENLWKLPVYIGHCETSQKWYRMPLFGQTTEHTEYDRKAMYREEHKFSGEHRYFAGTFGDRIYIEPKAYEQEHLIIPIADPRSKHDRVV